MKHHGVKGVPHWYKFVRMTIIVRHVLQHEVSINATTKSKRIAMRCKRAFKSPSISMSRRELNRASMSKNRALESLNESMTGREQIRFTLIEHSG